MAEQVTDAPPVTPIGLAEPTAPVSRGWIAALGLASLGMWMAALTPIQILLPEQLQAISPHAKIFWLGLVTALGAAAAIIATPLVGTLSDRTTAARPVGRLRGRRHRWTIAMALLGAVCLVLLSAEHTVAGVAVCWVLFSAFQNGQFASLSAAIPDHVPPRQRATVAGWVGMPQALGLVLGTALVVRFVTARTSGYAVLAAVLVLFCLPFVLATADPAVPADRRKPFSARDLLAPYRVDLRANPDFGWAWITRFLATLAIAMGTLYLLYFLRDAVHYHSPGEGLLILTVIYTVCVVTTATIGGVVSDRMGRRRLLVCLSGALMGAAAILLAILPTWPAAEIAAVLFGVGFGAYLAVDQALVTLVLPRARDRAKDLGLINIAFAGPVALGGFLAAVLVSAGGYRLLFLATAVVALLGAILVWRIKRVP